MIHFLPEVLYTKADLSRLAEEAGINVDYFLARLGAAKRFKGLWWGRDLLAALERVPILGDDSPPSAPKPERPRRRRREAAKETGEEELIGGVFSASRLGISSSEGCQHDRSSVSRSRAANHPQRGGE